MDVNSKMTTEICFSVKYTEVDEMGVVHHSKYPLWFENGRSDYLKKAGVSNSKIARKGFYLPLSLIECKYKSPARFGDEIIVSTKILSMTCAKLQFEYEILDYEKGKLLAMGRTVHAWTNQRIEPVNIEKAAPEIFLRIKEFSVL